MNYLKIIFTSLLIVLFFQSPILGQRFTFLDDANAYTIESGLINQFGEASTQLSLTFDSAGFTNQFKVFDFGFYSVQENIDEGFLNAFNKQISNAEISPYYLVFGRQLNTKSEVEKIWFELKVPTSGKFSCSTNFDLSVINVQILNALQGGPTTVTEAINREINAINILATRIRKEIGCCPAPQFTSVCSPCDKVGETEIPSYLTSLGFYEYPNYTISKEGFLGYGTLQSEYKITITGTTETGQAFVFNYTNDLDMVLANTPNSQARVTLFDNTNCNTIPLFSELNGSGMVYSEDIILLNLNNKLRFFSKVSGEVMGSLLKKK